MGIASDWTLHQRPVTLEPWHTKTVSGHHDSSDRSSRQVSRSTSDAVAPKVSIIFFICAFV
jgi:hypothetical protein